MIDDISSLRRRGIGIIAVGGWSVTLFLSLVGLLFDADVLRAALISGILNIIPSRDAIRDCSDLRARFFASVMVVAQAALLVYSMKSTGWQVDMHLYFFVALAGLAVFCDARCIVLASALIVLHHLVLAFAAPDWMFAGGGGLSRLIIHVVAVTLAGSILAYISLALEDLLSRLRRASEIAARQTEELHQAQLNAEQERSERELIKREINRVRKEEYARVAEDFESTVSSVTQSVAATAKLLENTTKALEAVAQTARDEATEVADSAQTATFAAQTVARGVAELSGSIANIAVNVSQQSDMTTRATERSSGGGKAVGSLSGRSDTISEATRAIVKIAERTNLLSLNAAIEAATAGPAGRGFTIVAQEVKALAQQAAQAATEIDELLSGVRSGTLEAERSFAAIDAVVAELDRAAIAIRRDVEAQRQSADTIEGYAHRAADDVRAMAERSTSLVSTAQTAQRLSRDLDAATARLMENVETLEVSTKSFASHLRSA